MEFGNRTSVEKRICIYRIYLNFQEIKKKRTFWVFYRIITLVQPRLYVIFLVSVMQYTGAPVRITFFLFLSFFGLLLSTDLQYPLSIQYSALSEKYYFIQSELLPEDNVNWTYIDSTSYPRDLQPKSPPNGHPNDGVFSVFSFLCFEYEPNSVNECAHGHHSCHADARCDYSECGYTCTCEERNTTF
jgi:hypothetical protein